MQELTPSAWRRLLRRAPGEADDTVYGPLLQPAATADGCLVLGRLAQSLDGYIATRAGQSQWISGPDDIAHTHRLRALFDAVVVGAGTVQADDPQLTTRLVEGPSPVRVVLDPARRLPADRRVFAEGPPTLVFCAAETRDADRVGCAEIVPMQAEDGGGGFDVHAVLGALRARGLRRIFIEGGGITVSRFLAARALDRLHVTVAPLLMGGGIPAFPLPPAHDLNLAPRFGWSMHRMGADVLLDIELQRTSAAPP